MMTATLDAVAKKKESRPEPAELQAARELVRQAKEQGLSLTGPDGLLKQLTKTVSETALDEELTEHLGHERLRAPLVADADCGWAVNHQEDFGPGVCTRRGRRLWLASARLG
jgi:hypothetical protein